MKTLYTSELTLERELLISMGFMSGQDVLGFTDQNGITGSYNSGTGVLTLSGTSSVANYQAALRSVTYQNTSDNPATNPRTFSFTVSDETLTSNPITRTATIVAINDAPVLTSSGGSLTYTENDPATLIDNSITVSDLDNANLSGASVNISTGFVSGQDVLGFTDQNGITGSYNSSTGVLTLTGTSSVANYQTALRSVMYRNTSDNPAVNARTFSFTVNDGSLNSNTLTCTLSGIVSINDAPALNNNPGGFAYIENDPPTVIDTSITVSDSDTTALASAQVSISAGFASDQDVLGFVDQNGITGSYNSTTGVLTLSGTSSVANYQSALRTVMYENTSDNPAPSSRTLSFTVNDGALDSNTVSRTAALIALNDAPVLTSSAGSFTYTENDGPTLIDSSLTVMDSDNVNLISARVSISGGFASSEDVLGFADQNGITGSYNSGNGVLTLSGTSSVANYQTALRSVTYQNTSDNPSTSVRTFSFTVSDDVLTSNPIARSANIVAVNDAPVLTNSSGTLTYTENDPATIIASSISMSDSDNTDLVSAQVSITAGFVSAQDSLSFTDQNGITGYYNRTTGILALSGSSAIAHYQTALRSVLYDNPSDNPATTLRTFSFTINDGDLNSNMVTQTATLIAINDPPVMTYNQLTIHQGETLALTQSNLRVMDVDTDPSQLQFTMMDIQHGYFERNTASGMPINTFTQQEIDTGNVIRFVHDDTDQLPAYQASVSDGQSNTPFISANVSFIPSPNFSTPSTPSNTGLIAGLAAGAGALTLGVIGASFWYVKRRQRLAKAREAEMGIEMVEGVRKEKGHTVIYGQQGNYALLNKIKAKEAQALFAQTGIEVTFSEGKNKTKFELGRGQFGKLRLAKITAVKNTKDKGNALKVDDFVGVKKIKGKTEIQLSKQEAEMQQKLSGKAHIMPLLESIETKGSQGQPVLYQFMPLAGFGNGETLQQYLAQLKDPTEKLCILVHVAKGLLTGMANMHDSHIYHLDMKPSNIVLSKEGDVYLIDFGCAQELKDGRLIGGNGDTRYYAPERLEQCRQARNSQPYPIEAAKVDAWAVGLTLLAVACNVYPFDTMKADERITQWDSAYFVNKLAKIEALATAQPKTYWALVKGLLNPDPKQRLSIEEALNAVNSLRQYGFASVNAQQAAFEELKGLEKQVPALTLPPILPSASADEKELHYALLPKANESRLLQVEGDYVQTPAKNLPHPSPSGQATYDLTPPGDVQPSSAQPNYDLPVEEKPKDNKEKYTENEVKQRLTLEAIPSNKVYQSDMARQTFFSSRAEQKTEAQNETLHAEEGGYQFYPATSVSQQQLN